MRIAAGLGIYVLPLKYSIKSSSAGNIEGADVTLPLPTLALRTDFLLSRNLYLTAGLDAMYIQISDFKGSLYDANIALEYRPWGSMWVLVWATPVSPLCTGQRR